MSYQLVPPNVHLRKISEAYKEEISLSSMWWSGTMPCSRMRFRVLCRALIISPCVLFFIGSIQVEFPSISWITVW